MRSIKEQVEQFIQGVSDGSILYLTSKLLTTNVAILQKEMGMTGDSIKNYGNMRREMIEDLIPKYINSKGKQKLEFANTIFGKMMWGRSIGLIYNDPNNLKELNWYRTQNERLVKENEKLQTSVKDLAKTILEMSGTKIDQKVGVK
jgi:hypothetical protein